MLAPEICLRWPRNHQNRIWIEISYQTVSDVLLSKTLSFFLVCSTSVKHFWKCWDHHGTSAEHLVPICWLSRDLWALQVAFQILLRFVCDHVCSLVKVCISSTYCCRSKLSEAGHNPTDDRKHVNKYKWQERGRSIYTNKYKET